jgi:GTP-binding protein HflX
LPEHDVDLLVPYDRGDVVALLHRRAFVTEVTHEDTGTRVRARVRPDLMSTVEPFVVAS